LITPAAEIAWWCTPRIDSAPTFWSLLDREGAAACFEDVVALGRTDEPAGIDTWTRLRAACGTIEVRDGMADGRLLRVVRCLDGDLDLCHRVCFATFGAAGPRTWTDTNLRGARGTAVAVGIGA